MKQGRREGAFSSRSMGSFTTLSLAPPPVRSFFYRAWLIQSDSPVSPRHSPSPSLEGLLAWQLTEGVAFFCKIIPIQNSQAVKLRSHGIFSFNMGHIRNVNGCSLEREGEEIKGGFSCNGDSCQWIILTWGGIVTYQLLDWCLYVKCRGELSLPNMTKKG